MEFGMHKFTVKGFSAKIMMIYGKFEKKKVQNWEGEEKNYFSKFVTLAGCVLNRSLVLLGHCASSYVCYMIYEYAHVCFERLSIDSHVGNLLYPDVIIVLMEVYQ